jgi:hypothetical protein
MNFNLDMQMPQRKLVEMGRIIGRVISINYVIQLSEKGFRKDLIDGSIVMLQQEISKLMASFSFNNKRVVVEGYQEDSDWFELI